MATAGDLPRSVLDDLLEGCQVIGFDWRYLYVNDAAAKQGRKRKEEMLGKTMMECYPGIESTPMFAELRRCMTERTPHRMENEFVFEDGPTGWFELRIEPVPVGICVLSLDITECKCAQDELRKTSDALRLLVDGVVDHAIFGVDVAGRVNAWNRGAERLYGYSASEAIGMPFGRFMPQDGATRNLLEEALARGRCEDETWRVRKDGTRFWANVVSTPLRDRDGEHVGFACVTRDLTERWRHEEQLRHAQKMEAIGRLAGGIAHDFNNILSVILSYTELITADLGSEEPMRADIEEIRSAALRATALTRQLLSFSRQQVVEARILNLNQTIASVEKMLRRLLGADVTLTLLPAPNLGNVRADAGHLEQVLVNLVVNARDAMPTGGKLTIETANVELDEDYARTHLDVRAGPHVMLAVSDTGIGMDETTQAHIFEPFFTTKGKDQGTGLGLSTVYGIVKQSGGHIWVYSEPGRGTTFKVYFPRESGDVDSVPSERLAPELLCGNETILLVEDDDQVRAVARNILRRQGYVVLEASNAGEALLIAEEHGGDIHLLLTDVVLPRMNGRQLVERLAPLRPNMKVLFMSGYTDDAVVQHGILSSGTPYLQKPVTPASLGRKVREALQGKNGR